MEHIKLTQTHALSLACSAVCESTDDLASAPAAIHERLIADEVLGVQSGHHKGIRRIVKGKGNASATSYSTHL